MTLFTIGNRVRLRHTGAEGVVMAHSAFDDMVTVRLVDDNLEIPVFREDLVSLSENLTDKKNVTKSTISPIIAAPEIRTVKAHSEKKMLSFVFEPIHNSLGDTVLYYKIFILNSTAFDFLCKIKFINRSQILFEKEEFLDAASGCFLGEMSYDLLNEQPEIEASCQLIGDSKSEKALQKTLKIKANTFFKNTVDLDEFHVPVQQLVLFDNFVQPEKKENPQVTETDLKTYTQQKIREHRSPTPYFMESKKVYVARHAVQELANFSTEIDLHIENLTSQHAKMSNGEIVQTQIQHFERFLDKAIRLGVPRVFIIHGLGKGKLRDLIASSLLQNRNVVTFKNEFHPRYGFGATEVIFQ